MRPSSVILDKFYDLADYNADKRHSAMVYILSKVFSLFYSGELIILSASLCLNECHRRMSSSRFLQLEDEEIVDYCVNRLIEGLSSPRAAARMGYTNALTQIFFDFSANWPVKRIFAIADEKLSLKSAVGFHAVLIAFFLFRLKSINFKHSKSKFFTS
ncbi:unnamed protein product [Dracunculus medinensis]|uniref:RICTOR_N domain-containing protein n=1 Tax=Dracunculus medinensis TaxID=318479 RepID=A0A0N4UIY0_DRAME|nr:unnamed protein product [Dracunculus medinensis]